MTDKLSCGCRLEDGVLKLCQKHGDGVGRAMAEAVFENDQLEVG